MRIACDIEYDELENENGYPVEGVIATCVRCDHMTESFGTSEASIKRCLVLMRQECPNGELNYYTSTEL